MFLKYPSIKNHYQGRSIDSWLKMYPALATESYVILEKIHGANFQIVFTPCSPLTFCSRTQVIPENESFNGYKTVVERMWEDGLSNLQMYADATNENVRIFGELFGNGIQKGVDYGDEKRYLIFGMMINDQWLSFHEMKDFLGDFSLDHYIVPVLGYTISLSLALSFNTDLNSSLNNIGDNIIEGVVIMPYDKVYVTSTGSVFSLKKKNDKFKEKAHAKKIVLTPEEKYSEATLTLASEYRSYLTENRVCGIFSKYGKIESKADMGRYIKLVLDDAKEDFLCDFDVKLDELGKDDVKFIFNGGRDVALILNTYL